MQFLYLNPGALAKRETSPMKLLIRILLLPLVVIIGASCGGMISGLAGFETALTLGEQRERAGLVEYEDDSPAFLAPFAGNIGLIGGAIGASVGATVGWICKRPIGGAVAGCLPLLILIFFCAFGRPLNDFQNYACILIALAIALSGPPLIGAVAGLMAKAASRNPQRSMSIEV